MKKRRNKKYNSYSGNRGQAWVETVIYTLIAFVMIGLVLAFARPKIADLQDRTILQQSTDMLKQIDTVILSMAGAGNQRTFEVQIKKGNLNIDGQNDSIFFEMESKNLYSEPGTPINDGSVIVLTEKLSGINSVRLTLDYKGDYDIKFSGKDELRAISPASNTYSMVIINKGDSSGKTVMDITIA